MKITKDGFIWKLLTEKEAMAYFNDEHLGELYLLFDDDSESLVERNSDILEHDGEYGIEVGRPTEEQSFDIVLGVRRYLENIEDDEPMDGDDTVKIAKRFLHYIDAREGNKGWDDFEENTLIMEENKNFAEYLEKQGKSQEKISNIAHGCTKTSNIETKTALEVIGEIKDILNDKDNPYEYRIQDIEILLDETFIKN